MDPSTLIIGGFLVVIGMILIMLANIKAEERAESRLRQEDRELSQEERDFVTLQTLLTVQKQVVIADNLYHAGQASPHCGLGFVKVWVNDQIREKTK